MSAENLGSRIAVWLADADRGYGPDLAQQVRITNALTAVVDLHVGCRDCNEGRACREIFVIAEALELVEVGD